MAQGKIPVSGVDAVSCPTMILFLLPGSYGCVCRQLIVLPSLSSSNHALWWCKHAFSHPLSRCFIVRNKKRGQEKAKREAPTNLRSQGFSQKSSVCKPWILSQCQPWLFAWIEMVKQDAKLGNNSVHKLQQQSSCCFYMKNCPIIYLKLCKF